MMVAFPCHSLEQLISEENFKAQGPALESLNA